MQPALQRRANATGDREVIKGIALRREEFAVRKAMLVEEGVIIEEADGPGAFPDRGSADADGGALLGDPARRRSGRVLVVA